MRRYPKKGGQFAIIWVDLLYEDAVPATGKLLFGEIYRLSGPDGWCDASNQDFMDLLGCSETTVRNLLKALEDVGQIRVVTRPRREGSGGTERWIFCGRKLAPPEAQEVPAKNCGYPGEGTRRNLRGVPAETCGSTSISNYNNTPYSPPKGDDPDLMRSFDLFWNQYPKKVKKKKARELWRKLRPDAGLVSVIMDALEKQKRSDRWKRDGGQYIPDPTTWLNGRRWEDELAPESDPRPPRRETYGWQQ